MRFTPQISYRVVILGGGSSGWMTAAYLAKTFGRGVSIQLIESPRIGTIGVGEATFSDIHLFFDYLGLEEHEWMRECHAAYKVAIKFTGWTADGSVFYHPFERSQLVGGRSLLEWWLRQPATESFDHACYASTYLCDALRSPRFLDGRDYTGAHVDHRGSRALALLETHQGQFPYAYHFDAALFANVLSRYAAARGVVTHRDEVVEVLLNERGDIRSLRLQGGLTIDGDLFIDCTGFKGLLINQTLKEPFISYLSSLPCDRAVAMQVPSDPATGMEPYTTATALEAGWVWNIPLFHRVGTGYVYSSAHISPDEAEAALRRHLGARAATCPASHITMRVGRTRHAWANNCVAIGLSGGFVEPLESTGLFFVQHAIEQLVTHLHSGDIDASVVASYNRAVGDCLDGVREFLTLHYVCASRSDTPFWRATKHELEVPGDLAERLQLWKRQLPTRLTINPRAHGFASHNYCAMLLGLGWRPEAPRAAVDAADDAEARRGFRTIKRRGQRLAQTLPLQSDYLARRYALESTPLGELASSVAS